MIFLNAADKHKLLKLGQNGINRLCFAGLGHFIYKYKINFKLHDYFIKSEDFAGLGGFCLVVELYWGGSAFRNF